MSSESNELDVRLPQTPPPAERLAIPEHALAALEYQARRHYRRWRLVRAEQIARRVIRFDLGRAEAWFLLGDVEMRRMHWRRAFQHFQQTTDCRRNHAMAWCRGAEALLRLQDWEQAEDWLRQTVALDPGGTSAATHRATQLLARYEAKFARREAPAVGADPSQAPTQQLPALGEAGPEQQKYHDIRRLRKQSRE